MTVKIKDVAQTAGVSVTSVSRVLNNEKYVSEEIKNKVKKAIVELGYSPSHIARSLKRKKTNIIGVIVPDLTSSFFSTILSSIEETASSHGYNLMVCNIVEDIDKEFKYLQVFKEMRVDGIIIMNEKVNKDIRLLLQDIQIPIIFCGKSFKQNYISIRIDNYKAAYEATKYLIDLGHKNIAFIGGNLRDVSGGQRRYMGYIDALKDHHIEVDDRLIRFGNYKIDSGYVKMKELLTSERLPTAVFAINDDMALGALNCIYDIGLKVPHDISVLGFDGSPLTDITRPRLTSMQQPISETGRKSVETLLQLIENQSMPIKDVILKHELVIRDSCKPFESHR